MPKDSDEVEPGEVKEIHPNYITETIKHRKICARELDTNSHRC